MNGFVYIFLFLDRIYRIIWIIFFCFRMKQRMHFHPPLFILIFKGGIYEENVFFSNPKINYDSDIVDSIQFFSIHG